MVKEAIFYRKSVRLYKNEEFTLEEMQELEKVLAGIKPLIGDIDYQVRIVAAKEAKGFMGIKAPYYGFFYSERKPGYLENIGFVGQHFSLYLSSRQLGSCWLGMAKSGKSENGLPYIIAMAFGKTNDPTKRKETEFNRLPMETISNTDTEIMAGVRLAPSAINFQDWYFYCEKDLAHCYSRKMNVIRQRLLGKMASIDLGIAICHMTLMCGEYECFESADYPRLANCVYFRTVRSANLLNRS